MIMYDAWVLKFARTPPAVDVTVVGIGTRKRRNRIGKSIIRSARGFRSMRVMPIRNIGRDTA